MSFILKALKKLEVEKAVRKAVPAEINSAILAPDKKPLSGLRMMGRWVIVPFLIMAGAGLIYIFLQKETPPVTEARKPDLRPASNTSATQPSQTVVQEVKTAQGVAKDNIPAGEQTASRQKEQGKKPETIRLRNSIAPPPEPARRASADAASTAMTVSGIAYQDNPAESMAVVNGALVKTGMSVGGVQVDRIFVDRVRFKGNGGTFEVPLAR